MRTHMLKGQTQVRICISFNQFKQRTIPRTYANIRTFIQVGIKQFRLALLTNELGQNGWEVELYTEPPLVRGPKFLSPQPRLRLFH